MLNTNHDYSEAPEFEIDRKVLTAKNYVKALRKAVLSVFETHFSLNTPEDKFFSIAKSEIKNNEKESCFVCMALELPPQNQDILINALIVENNKGVRIVISNNIRPPVSDDVLFLEHPCEQELIRHGEFIFLRIIKQISKFTKSRLNYYTGQETNSGFEVPQMPDKDITGKIKDFKTRGSSQIVTLELEDISTNTARNVCLFIPSENYQDFKTSIAKRPIFSWNCELKSFTLYEENKFH